MSAVLYLRLLARLNMLTNVTDLLDISQQSDHCGSWCAGCPSRRVTCRDQGIRPSWYIGRLYNSDRCVPLRIHDFARSKCTAGLELCIQLLLERNVCRLVRLHTRDLSHKRSRDRQCALCNGKSSLRHHGTYHRYLRRH